jgi:hypothetical protein
MSFDFEKYQNDTLKQAGFNPKELTEDQKWVILEPIDAPENYHCDGEVTPDEAYDLWHLRLQRAGLDREQISKAIKLNFGK